jgi:tryptophan synthase beta chain
MTELHQPATIARPGRFADATVSFGGQYVAPTLLPVLDRLETIFNEAIVDSRFVGEFKRLLSDHVGRPTPLMLLDLDEGRGGHVLLKREDLSNSGSGFGASVLGQCLLARRMGLDSVVADTGSGDHGVALAATAAELGLRAIIYIGDPDSRTQVSMVARMRAFGAEVVSVPGEAAMLHHAMSGAIQHWMAFGDTCLYVAGAPIGPHPYPTLVRHFQAAIGIEARAQMLDRFGQLPNAAIATMDGGSAAVGLFSAFLDDPVRLILVEPGGLGGGESAAVISHGRPGILHGAYTLLLQDQDGQLCDVASRAAGAAYPAAGPELAYWARSGRLDVALVKDAEAVDSMRWAARRHGILISLESAYGLAKARRLAVSLPAEAGIICAISAGGTKDLSLMERQP